MSGAWIAALWLALIYGLFLTITALRVPPGSELTGQFSLQPLFKAAPALLLAVAAAAHPIVAERRWLMAALFFSAAGDFLLAIPSWDGAFVAGLTAFLVAHLCFLGALAPLASRPTQRRIGLVAVVCAAVLVMLLVFWPVMSRDGVTIPVTIYIAVLCAMVSAALMARLPTLWTAVGALFFLVSDGMIGAGRFVLESEALAVPIWWTYALSLILITAGFFFGRSAADRDVSDEEESAPSVKPQG